MNGRLSIVPDTKLAIFESGAINSRNAVVFVGGLTDGLGTVAYLPLLSDALEKHGWALVDLQLSSSHLQFGFKSLHTDARDIEATVRYLRDTRRKEKIVLVGQSTGCQDAIWYATVDAETRPKIDAAILQAPVSDVEFFETYATPEARKWVTTAEEMVREGKGHEYLPREASRTISALFHAPDEETAPFTAYRFASLYGRGGDDDFFSSFIDAEDLKFAKSVVPLVLFLSDEDESYSPPLQSYEAKAALLKKWTDSSSRKISPFSMVLKNANHTIDNPQAQEEFCNAVIKFVETL